MHRSLLTALAAALLAVPVLASALEGWERLGSRTVEFRSDTDTIMVGRNEGRFRAIMIEVANGAVEMDNIRVVFGNGADFSPRTRLVFNEGQRTRAIDLPGAARIIRSIAFNYRSLQTGEGRAVVNVYGR